MNDAADTAGQMPQNQIGCGTSRVYPFPIALPVVAGIPQEYPATGLVYAAPLHTSIYAIRVMTACEFVATVLAKAIHSPRRQGPTQPPQTIMAALVGDLLTSE